MLFLIRETLIVHWGKGDSHSVLRKNDAPVKEKESSKKK